MELDSSKKATDHANNIEEMKTFVKATVANMMSVFAKAAQNSINNTVKEKLKSFKPPKLHDFKQ